MDKSVTNGLDCLGALARDLHAKRRRRDDLFEPGLFSEPAWDILLDLFALEQEGRPATLAMVAAGAAIPLETAVLFVGHLVDSGLVSREPPGATPWAFLQLTDDGRARMRLALGDILKGRRLAD